MRSRALVLILLPVALAGCPSPPPSPFEDLGAPGPEETLAVLARRTGARTLYAELEIAYEGPERSGTFEAAFYWAAPSSMRMTAFKDVVLAFHDVFDLVLTEQTYRLEAEDEAGDGRIEDRGPAAEFPDRHPGFAAFHAIREAFGLPGRVAGTARVEPGDGGPTIVRGRLSSGAAVEWRLDPRTLRVDEGRVELGPGRTAVLTYGEYRRAGEVLVPGRVRLEDAAAGTSMEARVGAFEVDLEIDPWVFE